MDYSNDLTELLGAYLVPLKGIEEILSKGDKGSKLLVETPLGFKNVGLEVVRYLNNKGYRAYLSGQNVWGGPVISRWWVIINT